MKWEIVIYNYALPKAVNKHPNSVVIVGTYFGGLEQPFDHEGELTYGCYCGKKVAIAQSALLNVKRFYLPFEDAILL